MPWPFKKKPVPTDPAAYYKVARRHRVDTDSGPDSDAREGGPTPPGTSERYRPGGDLYDDRVVPPEELQ